MGVYLEQHHKHYLKQTTKETAPMNNTPTIIAQAIARRTAAGLKLTFLIPADDVQPYDREWTCYPSSHEVRRKWIEDAAKKGWRVVED